MNRIPIFLSSLAGALLFAGCATELPPGAERGPHNTMAYDVLVETSPAGARIEANGEIVGQSPVHVKIFGDPDGTFHDFGSEYFEIRALPEGKDQYVQTRLFQTGHMLSPQDRIPKRIYFNMSQPPPKYVPVYVTPPPTYYDPFYYYGPSIRFYGGPRYYRPGGHYHHH